MVESRAMKQLPDILTSTTFWASIATLGAASGAWFTYVAAELTSRQRDYQGILSLVEGLKAEFALVSQWASGEEGATGYLVRTRGELVKEHADWFNPSRMVFTFDSPVLNNATNSLYARSIGTIMNQLVVLNHSIHRLFDYIKRYQSFVMGDVVMYQRVIEKFAPKTSPTALFASLPPTAITIAHPSQISWTDEERAYINHIFMMNEAIHQHLIGGADSPDETCMYKSFRTARTALQKFKGGLRRERLPRKFWVLHILAGAMALMGVWQVLRWFEVLR